MALVTQNDIAAIVKAQVQATMDVWSSVVGIFDVNVINTPSNMIQSAKNLRLQTEILFGKGGVISSIEEINNGLLRLRPISRRKLRWLNKYVTTSVQNIIELIKSISEQADLSAENIKQIKSLLASTVGIIGLLQRIEEINQAVSKAGRLKTGRARRKIIRILKFTNTVTELMESYGSKPQVLKNSVVATRAILEVFNNLNQIVDANNKLASRKIYTLSAKTLTGVLSAVQATVDKVNQIKRAGMAARKMKQIINIVACIGQLAAALILITPVLVAFILISPVIILAIWAFVQIINLIIRIVNKLLSPRVILTLVAMISVLVLITLMASALLILMVIAIPLLKGMVSLLLFFGSLVLIFALIGLIGFGLSLLLPFMIPMLLGFGLMLLAITAIFLIGIQLAILAQIKLDPVAIITNVAIILGVANQIISMVFAGIAEPEEKENIFTRILTSIGGGILTLVKALFASMILVATIASVAAILIIATMLRILQVFRLDKDKITENVSTILSTARLVIDSIFDPIDNKNNPSKKTWGEKLLGAFKGIIEAIMAVSFLALSLISISLVLLLATELRIIQSINLDHGKIRTNVSAVIGAAQMVADSIFDPQDDKNNPSKKSWGIKLLGAFGDIIEAIMAVAFLALSLISISMILLLAKQLSVLQGMELNQSAITDNVSKVINTARLVIDTIMSPDTTQAKRQDGIFGKILGWAMPGLKSILDALTAVGFLAVSLAAIGIVVKLAKMMQTIQKIDNLNGVGQKAIMVVNSARQVCTLVYENTDKFKVDKTVMSSLRNMGRILKQLKKISKTLTGIGELSPESIANSKLILSGALESLLYIAEHPLDEQSLQNRLNLMKEMNDVILKLTDIKGPALENSKQVTDNYIRFIEKIGNTNLDNLRTTVSLFDKMAQFSNSIQGNFDGLADTLNEKIAPLLEELKTIMESLPQKIDESTTSINNSISTQSDANSLTMTSETAKAQARRNNPSASDDEIKRMVDQKMSEQARQKATGIEAKLDELLDILSGNAGNRGIPVHIK